MRFVAYYRWAEYAQEFYGSGNSLERAYDDLLDNTADMPCNVDMSDVEFFKQVPVNITTKISITE